MPQIATRTSVISTSSDASPPDLSTCCFSLSGQFDPLDGRRRQIVAHQNRIDRLFSQPGERPINLARCIRSASSYLPRIRGRRLKPTLVLNLRVAESPFSERVRSDERPFLLLSENQISDPFS